MIYIDWFTEVGAVFYGFIFYPKSFDNWFSNTLYLISDTCGEIYPILMLTIAGLVLTCAVLVSFVDIKKLNEEGVQYDL